MKLGQVMSFLDVGLVPEEHREEFQRKLGELRDAAPKVRFSDMRKVIESELDEPLEETFAAFEHRADRRRLDRPGLPRAAARRPRRRGQGPVPGRRPGRAGRHAEPRDDPAADEADRAGARRQVHGGGDPRADRRRARLRARGPEPAHAGAHLPRPPVHRRARRRLLALAREGDGHRVRRPAPASTRSRRWTRTTRDRVGEIVFRFFFGCMYRHRQFSGDPHPGNFLLQPDGKRRVPGLRPVQGHAGGADPRSSSSASAPATRATASGSSRSGPRPASCAQPDRFRPDKLLAQFLDATWWYVLDEEIELQPEVATQVMIEMSDPRSSHFGQMRHETLPADHLFGRRVEMLTLAVLSQLRARGELPPDRARVDVRRRARDRAGA